MKTSVRTRAAAAGRRFSGVRVVALYLFTKALLLLGSDYGLYRLLDARRAVRVARWTATLTDLRARRLLLQTLEWFGGLGVATVHLVMWVTLLYALLALIEGYGLWRHRRWAEWLTVVASAALVPFEIWQLVTRPAHETAWVLSVLLANVIIVVYLATRLTTGKA
jgi:uncharacterized membrane protein (DUF2068 family)